MIRCHLLIAVAMPLICLRVVLIRLDRAGAALQGCCGVLIAGRCRGHSPCSICTSVLARNLLRLVARAFSLPNDPQLATNTGETGSATHLQRRGGARRRPHRR